MPAGLVDRVAYLGMTADVWMDRSVTAEGLPATMAGAYRTPPPGRVALVLGAGNASSIGPLDAIHKLFVEQQVVVLKLHPVMAHLAGGPGRGPRAARPRGRAADRPRRPRPGRLPRAATRAWTRSTSPARTGPTTRSCTAPAPRASERRRRDEPVLAKPFTAELGNLTPIIVVPGRWSDARARLPRREHRRRCSPTTRASTARRRGSSSRPRRWPQRADAAGPDPRAASASCRRASPTTRAPRQRFDAFREVHAEAELFGSPARRAPAVDADPGPLAGRRRATPATASRRSAA